MQIPIKRLASHPDSRWQSLRLVFDLTSSMGDVVQLLMIDHFSIKLSLNPVTGINSSRFESIIHFMTECHFELEENAIFPVIESAIPEDKVIHEKIKKALSDHILIRRTARTIIESFDPANSEDGNGKFAGFFKTLVQHDLYS